MNLGSVSKFLKSGTAFLKWIVGGLLLTLGAVALVLHKTSGSGAAAQAAINAVEAAHAPKIAALTQQLTNLKQNESANQIDITKAELEVQRRKDALRKVYQTTGLSDDEVVDRLSNLKV